MTKTQTFYGKQVRHELAVQGRHEKQLAEDEREDAMQDLVCDRVTDFVSEMCRELGLENNYDNRKKIAEMIQKTF